MTNYAGLENEDSAAVLAVRLRAARESKGRTQAQAASELGVSRPLLIAIEKGTRDPNPEEIVRLAQIYDKPVSELLRSAPPPIAIGARFRAALAAGADAEELSGAVGQLEREADNYIDLLQRASTQAPGRYPPTRSISHLDPWQAGEDLATEERNRLGIGDGPIRQLREVLEIEVGLRVFLLTLPRHVAGLFVYVDELGGCMGVNINHPSERRHWTIRLEDLRLIAPGTWDRLLDNDFQPRAAARILGLGSAERRAEALPLHYRLLAVQLYADGEITESRLARYLGTDIVGARRAYQKLTETGDVADDGSPQIVDLAEAAG
jgi:transcriptional regulator with XRE-family HTH domain